MNPPSKDQRNNAIRKDIKRLSLGQVSEKYGISRQRVAQITGYIKKYRSYKFSRHSRKFLTIIISQCKQCGKEYEHLPSINKRYCSKKCWNKTFGQRVFHLDKPAERETVFCPICHKEIYDYVGQNRKYCSQGHANKGRKL